MRVAAHVHEVLGMLREIIHSFKLNAVFSDVSGYRDKLLEFLPISKLVIKLIDFSLSLKYLLMTSNISSCSLEALMESLRNSVCTVILFLSTKSPFIFI